MNGTGNKLSFDDYQRLTPDQREFFTFDQLSKIDGIYTRLAEGEKLFAGKWVETAVKTFIYVIVVGFVGSLLFLLGWHTPPNS